MIKRKGMKQHLPQIDKLSLKANLPIINLLCMCLNLLVFRKLLKNDSILLQRSTLAEILAEQFVDAERRLERNDVGLLK